MKIKPGIRVNFLNDKYNQIEGTVVYYDKEKTILSKIKLNDDLSSDKFLTFNNNEIFKLKIVNDSNDIFLNKTSRTKYLEECLFSINAELALKAFELVIGVMNANNGYTRHNGSDYFLHLIDVTQILFNYGVRNDEILAASLLHDIVEDCEELGYTLEYIKSNFTSKVAFMVDKVTKKKEFNYKDPEIMEKYLEEIFEDLGSSLIKTGDRMHNFGTLNDATREKIIKQKNETKNYFIPFFKKCRKRYPKFSGFFFAAKTSIEPHIWEIEKHEFTVQVYEKRIKELEKQLKIFKLQI